MKVVFVCVVNLIHFNNTIRYKFPHFFNVICNKKKIKVLILEDCYVLKKVLFRFWTIICDV